MDDWENERVVVVQESWEDEEVADSWDAEEEEVKPVECKPEAPKKPQSLPKKPSASAAASNAAAVPSNETSEERKQRLNRLVQESDLENAMALFGISREEINVDAVLAGERKAAPSSKSTGASASSAPVSLFDSANPQTWNEFETLTGVIVKRLKTFEASKHYPNFLEGLLRALLADRDIPEIRKIVNTANELVSSKQRDKLSASKKKAPTLAGASKKQTDMLDFDGAGEYDDF